MRTEGTYMKETKEKISYKDENFKREGISFDEDLESYVDTNELNELKVENDKLSELARIMLSDIKEIYSSWCWKITFPIRAVINLFTIGQIEGILPGYLLAENPYEKLLFSDEENAEMLFKTNGFDTFDALEEGKKSNVVRELLKQYNPKPWNVSAEERIRLLKKDIESGKKIVVHIYDIADASTFRYTCYNVAQYMENNGTYGVHYFFQTEYRIVSRYIDHISLLVFCRTKWRISYSDLIKEAKSKSIPIVMQIDDLVCSMDYLEYILKMNLDKKGSDFIYDSWFSNVSRLERIAREVDSFIVTNDYLGESLKKTFNKEYVVIRNSLNREQISISQKLLEIQSEGVRDKFIIGYFSGSPTHKKDLEVIIDDIKRLLDNYSDIVFLMVGYMELPYSFKKYIKSGRVIVKKLVNFLELQYLISLADVNMVPLEDNIFTNCKSELKFFEAAIVGTITVATPTYTYKNCISDRTDGFLCRPGEWYQTIADIHDGKYDIPSMVERAKNKALDRYSGNTVVEEIEKAYCRLLGES